MEAVNVEYRVYEVFVSDEGHASLVEEVPATATGIRVTTNLHPNDINRRNKEEGWVGFHSKRAVRVWAKSIEGKGHAKVKFSANQ